MSNKKDARPIFIRIPQRRSFSYLSIWYRNNKTALKIHSERSIIKPTEISLRKFSLSCSQPLQATDLKKDGLILPYSLYAKKQDSINRQRRDGIKPEDKYKSVNIDMRQRLFVDTPANDVRTVREIDDGYFRSLNSHTSTTILPLYRTLKFQYHEHLRTMQEVGYRRDCVLLIDHNHKKMLQKYAASFRSFIEQHKLFEKFISEDYKKSIECLDNSEDLAAKVIAKQLELEGLANKQLCIQSKLIGLNFSYFVQQKYGRFLYYVSPPNWRAQHRDFARSIEIEAKGFDLGNLSEEDTFNVILKKMQHECFSGLIKPVLYFSSADTLLSFFNVMEKQLLDHFTLAHLNDIHVKSITENVLQLKNDVKNDSAFIAAIIEDIGEIIDFLEDREEYLKARLFKILNGLFYDTVAATDVLKLQSHLEYCFERVFLAKSTMDIVTIARDLEKMYMEYLFRLEEFSSDNAAEALKESIKTEKEKMKMAHNATKELRHFDRLEGALLKTHVKVNRAALLDSVHGPSSRKAKRQIPKVVVETSTQHELTEVELEYLALFTEWTGKNDPSHYLHSLSVEKDPNSINIPNL